VLDLGNRPIDLGIADHWRDQLWAEALCAYRAGEEWWLSPDQEVVRSDVNAQYEAAHPWYDVLQEWIVNNLRPQRLGDHNRQVEPERVSSKHIVTEVLEIPVAQQKRGYEMELAQILVSLGYEGKKSNGRKIWQLKEEAVARYRAMK